MEIQHLIFSNAGTEVPLKKKDDNDALNKYLPMHIMKLDTFMLLEFKTI